MPFVPVYRHASFRSLALLFVLAAAMVASLASAVSASTITFSLIPGPGGPGTFELTAQTSIGDNFGLDYYAVTIAGAATIQHVSVSPMGGDLDSGSNYGFSFARSADNVAVVSAAQDSVGGGVPVYGMGQTAGTLKSQLPAGDAFAPGRSDSIGAYGAPVVLAAGTYLDNVPPTLVTNAIAGFVFTSQGAGGAFGSFAAPSNFVINQFDGSSTSTPDPLAPPVNPQPTVPTTPEAPPIVTPPLATAPPIVVVPTQPTDDPAAPPLQSEDPNETEWPISQFVIADGPWLMTRDPSTVVPITDDYVYYFGSSLVGYAPPIEILPPDGYVHRGGLQSAMITALTGLKAAETTIDHDGLYTNFAPSLISLRFNALSMDLASQDLVQPAVETPEPAGLALLMFGSISLLASGLRRR